MRKCLVFLCIIVMIFCVSCGEPEDDYLITYESETEGTPDVSSETTEAAELPETESTKPQLEYDHVIANPAGTYDSATYCIIDDSGKTYIGRHELSPRAPASITKVLTALVVCENASLDDTVTIREEDLWDHIDLMSSGVYPSLKPEEKVTVQDLLYALLLPSTNAAANILATHVSGSLSAFTEKMNEKVAVLGLTHSHFSNPHGLDGKDHYTCAYDMAMILRAATKNEFLKPILGARTYQIPATEYTPARTMTMGHKMINGEFPCEGVYAGKTGSTVNAKSTLVTAVERNGQKFYVCTMGSAEHCQYEDTDNLIREVYCYGKNMTPALHSVCDHMQIVSQDAGGVNLRWNVQNTAQSVRLVYWNLGIGTGSAQTIYLNPQKEMNYHLNCPAKGSYMVQLFSVGKTNHESAEGWALLYDGAVHEEGFLDWNGQKYYINDRGFLEIGAVETGDTCYYSNNDGGLAKGFVGGRYFAGADYQLRNGWIDYGNQKYYASADGRLVKGLIKIEGQVYQFGDNGALMP